MMSRHDYPFTAVDEDLTEFNNWNFKRKYGNNMRNLEALEKGKLIKEALRIVDKLADSDLADIDEDITSNDFDFSDLQDLILKARGLKKDRWWKLT
jgi:hypothetical protein